MDFDLSQVRAFVVAADEGHFGRAAARLFLSQQGLSKRIQRLEQQVGEALFERRHNRVPELVPQLSMRRSTSAALSALDRGEIDVAFGRPFDLAEPIPARVRMEPVCFERLGVAVSMRHQESAAEKLNLDQVRRAGLWWPLGRDGQEELTRFLEKFGDRFEIPVSTDGVNLGRDQLVAALEADLSRFASTA